jgi:two-component system, cell cycle sensor histidine kinase and response regulator CckA
MLRLQDGAAAMNDPTRPAEGPVSVYPVCVLYGDDEGRSRDLTGYIRSATRACEGVVYVASGDSGAARAWLGTRGVQIEEEELRGRLAFADAGAGGLHALAGTVAAVSRDSVRGVVHVIGEPGSDLREVCGSASPWRIEDNVSEARVIVLSQYDIRCHAAEDLLHVLGQYPGILLNGEVHRNPYYEAGATAAVRLARRLSFLGQYGGAGAKPAGGGLAARGTEGSSAERPTSRAATAEAHYRRLVETSPYGVFATDPDGRLIEVNPALAGMLGHTVEHLLGRSFLDLLVPAEHERMAAQYRGRMAGDLDRHEYTVRALHASGDERVGHVTTSPIVVDDVVAGSHGVVRDITDETQLAHERNRLHTLVEASPDLIGIRDTAGGLLYRNRAGREFFGSAGLQDVHPTWALTRMVNEAIPAAIRDGSWVGESAIVSASGREVPVSQLIVAHADDAGEVAYLSSIMRDVSGAKAQEREREQLVLELQAERDKWRQVLDVAPAFMAVVRGPDYVFDIANAAFLEFVGRSELVGLPLLEALPELESQGTSGRLDDALQTGTTFCAKELPVLLSRRAGEPLEQRYATLVYLPITEADGTRTGVLCHGVDVTEQVLARRRIEEAAADAELNAARLNAVLEALPVGVCVLNTDGQVGLANAAAVETLGGLIDAASLHATDVLNARRTSSGQQLTPQDWPSARALLTGEDAADEEIEIEAPDGTRRTVVASGRLIRDAAGEFLGAVAVTVDVTTRKKGEDALRESEERFRTLVSSTNDVVFTLDTELRHTSMYGGLDLAQEARDFVCGKRAREVFGDDKAEVHEAAAARALVGENVVYEWEEHAGGERRFNQTSLSPLRDSSGRISGVIGAGRDVTELKRIQEARRESDARFRLLIEGIEGVVFYVQDRDGALEYVSPSVEKALGYTPDELVGRSLTDFCADDASREILGERTRALVEGDATGGLREVLLRTRTGAVGLVEIVDSVVIRDGAVTGVQGIARDITRQRAAESAATQLGRIMETSVSEIYLIDRATGRYLQASRGALENLGYTAEEFCRLGPADLLDATSIQCLERKTQPLLDGAVAVLSVDGEHRRKDGSRYPVEARIQLARRADREVIVVTALDVSERRRAEEQLRLLGRAVEQSPATIMVTDPTGNIVYVNRRFTESSGYGSDEVLGANPRILQSGSHDPAFYEEMWAALLSHREWTGDLQNRRKDGSLYWEHASITAVVDAAGQTTNYLGIKEDITERRRLEDQLRHSQKMEAVGQLAGGIAHDFNNMLTAIQGFAGLLESEVPPGSAGAVYLSEVQKAAARSAALTRQLLAYSRKQILQPHVMDMNETITGMESMLRRLIGENVQLNTRLAPGLPPIFADPRQMEHVLMNMALNARDAMPGGGCLEIATRLIDGLADGPDPRTHGRQWVATTVTDTGHGMDADTVARVFEPFFTTKPVGEGTGLGLPMAHGIIAQSGGHIVVESTPGAGSSFCFLLPAGAGCGDDDLPAIEPFGDTAGDETIIVVEDEDAVRALTVAVLTRAGYRVVAAHNGEAAIALMDALDIPVHLLLTDVVMPGIDGRELASMLQGGRPELKVLFMSGYTDDAVLRTGVIADECHFLQKPFQPQALLTLVRALLRDVAEHTGPRLIAAARPCAHGAGGPHCCPGSQSGRNGNTTEDWRRRHTA